MTLNRVFEYGMYNRRTAQCQIELVHFVCQMADRPITTHIWAMVPVTQLPSSHLFLHDASKWTAPTHAAIHHFAADFVPTGGGGGGIAHRWAANDLLFHCAYH